MSKSIFQMSDEEFEEHLRQNSMLSPKQKRARWNALNQIGETSGFAAERRLELDKFRTESKINGDFENESPY